MHDNTPKKNSRWTERFSLETSSAVVCIFKGSSYLTNLMLYDIINYFSRKTINFN